MHRVIPPLLLVLSLLMFVAGFAVLGLDRPQPGIALHEATAEGDTDYQELLENQLEARRVRRNVLIGSLFALSAVAIVAAFVTMRPARIPRSR